MATETYLENENRRDLRIVQQALTDVLLEFQAKTPRQIRVYRHASQVVQKTAEKLASATIAVERLHDAC